VARALLRDNGYRDFTVDAISERTGIAKTTIYRRFPSKGALIAAAIAPMLPPSDSDDVTTIFKETRDVLRLLSDPEGEALDVVRAVVEPRRTRIRTLLEKRGNENPDLTADLIVGALLTRLLVTRNGLENVDEIVRTVNVSPSS
jgi:AcrR family transcriptional regulator